MAVEQYTNDAVTALDGGINNSVTSIDVDSFTGFPASAQYRIRIDDEIMLVTAGAGTTTWTVTRGAEGTMADSHLNAASVTHVLTAGAIDQMRIDNCGAGSIASRPAAAKEGRLYLPTDGCSIQRDTGSLWTPYGPIAELVQTKVASDFTWVNQGGATFTDKGGDIAFYCPTDNDASGEWRILTRPAPSTPYTVTALFTSLGPNNSAVDTVGIGWRQSSDGKFTLNVLRCTISVDNVQRGVGTYAGVNSDFSATSGLALSDIRSSCPYVWLRISDNGTDRKSYMSCDGINFYEIHSIARTTFLTGDQICFAFESHNSSVPTPNFLAGNLHSWEES